MFYEVSSKTEGSAPIGDMLMVVRMLMGPLSPVADKATLDAIPEAETSGELTVRFEIEGGIR